MKKSKPVLRTTRLYVSVVSFLIKTIVGSLLVLGLHAKAREVGDAIYHRGDNQKDIVGVHRRKSEKCWGLSENYLFTDQHPGHAMVFVGQDEDGRDWIMEAPGNGLTIRMSDLDAEYLGHHKTYRVLTHSVPSSTARRKIVAFSISKDGLSYAAPEGLFDGKPSVQQQKGKRAYRGSERYTCIGLVEAAYEYAGLNATPDGDGRDCYRASKALFSSWGEAEGSYVHGEFGDWYINWFFGEGWVFFPYTMIYKQTNKLSADDTVLLDDIRMAPSVGAGPTIWSIAPKDGEQASARTVRVSCNASDGANGSGVFKVEFELSGPEGFSQLRKCYTYHVADDQETPVTMDLGNGRGQTPVFWYENESVPIELDEYGFDWDASVAPRGSCRLTVTAYDRAGNTEAETVTFQLVDIALDLVFCIDSTGSMEDDIDAVKASATSIIGDLAARFPDHRVAVVDYRDFPIDPYGDPGDFTCHDRTGFTTDDATAVNAINSIAVEGGNDWRESVYSALAHCIDGSTLGGWREDPVIRAIILMGDAPLHDPEPFTGYTLQSIVDMANKGGTIITRRRGAVKSGAIPIHSIIVGDNPDTIEAFQALAEGTQGALHQAADASEVVDTILEALETIETGGSSAVIDVTGDVTTNWPADSWQMNPKTGTMLGRLVLTNNTDSTKTLQQVFRYAVPETSQIRLMHPDGTLDDGTPYIDVTAKVEAALPGVGNGDLNLDPGETVIIDGIEFYSHDRTTPLGHVYAVWADPPVEEAAPAAEETEPEPAFATLADLDWHVAFSTGVQPGSADVLIGAAPNATDDEDAFYDDIADDFACMWSVPDDVDVPVLAQDIRPLALRDSWVIKVSEQNPPTELTWSRSELPIGLMLTLTRLDDGGRPMDASRVEVTPTGTIQLDGASGLAIELGEEAFAELPLVRGWNMVSFPLTPVPGSIDALLAALPDGCQVLGYGKDGYIATNVANALTSLCVFSPEATTMTVRGLTVTDPVLHLNAGWNLIGVPYECAIPDCAVGQVWEWSQDRYCEATILEPGKAYWIFALQAETIRLDAARRQ